MNTKIFSRKYPFALLSLALLWQVPAYAQQTYDYWNRPTNSGQGFSANRSTTWSQPTSVTSGDEAQLDFERVRSAWENYRREAMRYQSRYGEQNFLRAGGRRFESRSPYRSTGNQSSEAWRGPRQNFGENPSSRFAENVRPTANIRDIQSSEFESRAIYERPESRGHGDCRACPQRGAANARPRLAPLTPTAPYRELDRGDLRRSSAEFRPYSDVRESFRSPQPLRAVPMSRSQTEFDSQRNRGLFSTPKIDPSQLASRAETFFSSHLGN